MNEFNLTEEEIARLQEQVADLQIQAMLFDLAIDCELLTLCEKTSYAAPMWLSRYKDKVDAHGDNFANDQENNWEEE